MKSLDQPSVRQKDSAVRRGYRTQVGLVGPQRRGQQPDRPLGRRGRVGTIDAERDHSRAALGDQAIGLVHQHARVALPTPFHGLGLGLADVRSTRSRSTPASTSCSPVSRCPE
jgi:hypothetical protein